MLFDFYDSNLEILSGKDKYNRLYLFENLKNFKVNIYPMEIYLLEYA